MNKKSDCINCQILGFQKALDLMLTIDQRAAVQLCSQINDILCSESYNEHSKHLVSIELVAGHLVTMLVPKKHGKPPITREKLTHIFIGDGKPHTLTYQRRGWQGEDHKSDLPTINELIREGLVKVVHKDLKTITYQYTQKP